MQWVCSFTGQSSILLGVMRAHDGKRKGEKKRPFVCVCASVRRGGTFSPSPQCDIQTPPPPARHRGIRRSRARRAASFSSKKSLYATRATTAGRRCDGGELISQHAKHKYVTVPEKDYEKLISLSHTWRANLSIDGADGVVRGGPRPERVAGPRAAGLHRWREDRRRREHAGVWFERGDFDVLAAEKTPAVLFVNEIHLTRSWCPSRSSPRMQGARQDAVRAVPQRSCELWDNMFKASDERCQ